MRRRAVRSPAGSRLDGSLTPKMDSCYGRSVSSLTASRASSFNQKPRSTARFAAAANCRLY